MALPCGSRSTTSDAEVLLRERRAEVHRGRGLPDPALLVGDRDHRGHHERGDGLGFAHGTGFRRRRLGSCCRGCGLLLPLRFGRRRLGGLGLGSRRRRAAAGAVRECGGGGGGGGLRLWLWLWLWLWFWGRSGHDRGGRRWFRLGFRGTGGLGHRLGSGVSSGSAVGAPSTSGPVSRPTSASGESTASGARPGTDGSESGADGSGSAGSASPRRRPKRRRRWRWSCMSSAINHP